MAYLGNIETNELPESDRDDNFEPLPAGDYQATILACELKDTKAGTGQYLNVRYGVTGPTHVGRNVFGMVTLRNPSAEAERIGREQLRSLLVAVGLPRIQDTIELVGRSCTIKVGIKPAQGDYPADNTVKGWRPLAGASAPLPGAAPRGFAPPKQAAPVAAQTQPAAPAAASSSPPWARK